ncbi:bifunctional diguanylate cyclase/phosphodiesterase [Desulforhopalus singaporensis]|uniref:Diguanylate cyclase (GGDEF) domain-containing protein n=1 Tax=Desulforhopalus singaporensis TaxID=91360 RepID=A0A1H0VXZ5_9BACT|nr:EAL domain-containing protein [Desulforhopalus singaporensis]SDP83183.1 diguanylate cyclase (GGDEF) domain-containing protein [Desulforhopalus singaporensis]
MTLYRQLLVATSILFLILFTCTWVAKLNSTRTFLENQLVSHAQDTATSLALSINPYLVKDDLATIDAMISAVFDRGYYRMIRLTDLEEKTIIDKENPLVITNVPQWFIDFVELRSPPAKTLVSSGWIHKGFLYVESHPGYAYNSLWQASVNITQAFVVVGVVVLSLGAAVLQYLLRPLRLVEQQANRLCQKNYIFQEKIPRTRELRQVVVAMNGMTKKIKQMFEEQSDIADSFRKNAYLDPLTGLGNRRFFDSQFTVEMSKKDEPVYGTFFLIEIQNLPRLNRDHGYQYVDSLMQKIAGCLDTSSAKTEDRILSRLSGGSFCLQLPSTTVENSQLIIEDFIAAIYAISSEDPALPENLVQVGGLTYESPISVEKILAGADRTVRKAEQKGPNSFVIVSLSSLEHAEPIKGKMDWLQIIEKAIIDRDFVLASQPVVHFGKEHTVLHHEIFSKLRAEDGKEIHAGLFIPFAEQLDKIVAVDQIIIEKVSHLKRDSINIETVAINISASSLKNDTFLTELDTILSNWPETAPKVAFEITEYTATQDLQRLLQFSAVVKGYGHTIGIDRFGKSFSHFGYLQSLQPQYVKIDKVFTGELTDQNTDSWFFISSLVNVAHSLDIKVIAEGIEDATQLESLNKLHLDGAQGFFLGVPKSVN